MLQSLAEKLAHEALLTGDFTLRSGEKSRFYFDKFLVTTNPGLLRLVAISMSNRIRDR